MTGMFDKLRNFSESIEQAILKDKKFGFMEESILETKDGQTKTVNSGFTRAEQT